MDKDKETCIIIGFFLGALAMMFVWLIIADIIERSKVNAGYLTFKNKTYTVKLYDTLDIPESE